MEIKTGLGEKELADLCAQGAFEAVDAALSSVPKLQNSLSRTALKLLKGADLATDLNTRKAIFLAAVYTASEAELLKVTFWPGFFREVISSSLLRSVPRERLQFLAERLLDTSSIYFENVKDLYDSGLIDKPATNGYVAGLIARCSWPNKNRGGLAQTLLSQAQFMEDDVWLLFKFAGTAENCLAGADKYLTNAGESWQSVLAEFSAQGLLDRRRLLDESLRALSRDFNQFRAGWFSRFHEALKPTVEERAQRLDAYQLLLGSSVPPTVSLALSMIASVDKAFPVSFSGLAPQLPNALSSKSKQTVLGALKLLESCAEREPSQRRAICIVACTGLVSESAEVQNKIISLISRYAEDADAEIKECISSYLPTLSASVRKNLPGFLQVGVESPAINPRELAVEVSAPESRVLAPVQDLNELVLKVAFVLEHPESFCDYELVLDGILRFCSRDQDDFAMRTSPLLQRSRKLFSSNSESIVRSLVKSLAKLVFVWISDELPDSGDSNSGTRFSGFSALHQQRMQCIIERVRKREALPLLSLPTDEFGWLDAERLRSRLESGVVPDDPWDKCFALLRLRNGETSDVESVIAGSSHPALLFARSALLEVYTGTGRLIDWSINTRTSHGYAFTSLEMSPDPCTLMPGGVIGDKSPDECDGYYYRRSLGAEVLAEGSLMPTLRQAYFASGAQWLGSALQYTDVADKSARFYLHFLNDNCTRPGVYGSLVLALSISSGDQDISVAGVDAFISLIAQQRFDFDATADAMYKLFHHGDCVKANRWAKNLREVAKASSAHSEVIYLLLQKVLSTPLLAPPRDIHHLLELLVELHAECGDSLQEPTALCLAGMKVSGKTKKLVEALTKGFKI